MDMLKGLADSFEEIHYLIGGVAIGIVIGIIIMLVAYKVIDNLTGN